MTRYSACLLILAFVPVLFSRAQDNGPAEKDFYLYSIGNSHTWDFRPSADFLEIARAMHVDIRNGWHINCGQNLKTILEKPGQTCVDPGEFGLYRDAIERQRWDAITLQTFFGGTGREEKEAIRALLDFISQSINRDAWHLNNVGRYMAGLTVFAQLLRIDPLHIPDFNAYHPSDQWPGDRVLTLEQKKRIREIISEVLEF